MTIVTSAPTTSFATEQDTSFVTDLYSSFGSDNTHSSFGIDTTTTFEPVTIQSFAPHLHTSLQPAGNGNGFYTLPVSSSQGFYPTPVSGPSVNQSLIGRPGQFAPWQSTYPPPPHFPTTPEPVPWEHANSFSSPDTAHESSSPQNTLKKRAEDWHANGPQRKKKRAHLACLNCRRSKAGCDEGNPTCARCYDAGVDCIYEENKQNKKEDASQLHASIRRDLDEMDRIREEAAAKVKSQLQAKESEIQALKLEVTVLQAKRCDGGPSFRRSRTPLKEKPLANGETIRGLDGRGLESRPVKLKELNEKNAKLGSNLLPYDYSLYEENGSSSACTTYTLASDLAHARNSMQQRFKKVSNPPFGIPEEEDGDSLAQLTKTAVYVKRDLKGFSSSKPSPRSSFSTETSEGFVQVNRHATSLPSIHSSRITARDLYDSYQDGVHISFKFMDTRGIERIIDRITDYQQPSNSTKSPQIKRQLMSGFKRKYKDESSGSTGPANPTSSYIEAATVLLVFALGEVCQHEATSTPQRQNDLYKPLGQPQCGFATRNESFLPCPPPIPFATLRKAGLPVHEYLVDENRSADDDLALYENDLPTQGVPGLYYYCCAVGLLGELCNASDISFIQARLLAAIYLIRLVRPREAFYEINDIIESLYAIQDVRGSLTRMTSGDDDVWIATHNACLSLQSDALAQLEPSSPSEASKHLSQILLPRNFFDTTDLSIVAQPHLGSLLKSFVEQTCGYNEPNAQCTARCNMAKFNANEEHNTPVALKLLVAQWRLDLRESDEIIRSDPCPKESPRGFKRTASYDNIHRRLLHHLLRSSDRRPFDNETVQACKCCVNELMTSAETFDAIRSGRAASLGQDTLALCQGQFANIILLAQASESAHFHHFVDRNKFVTGILNDTINLFTSLASQSSIIEAELLILSSIQRRFF